MILVVGTGRCGTSIVAKLLHEHGINMGSSFRSSSEHENGSTYEDVACEQINRRFFSHETNYDQYLNELCLYGRKRKEPWGVKHPAISYVLGIYLQVFDPVIIRCLRDERAVIKSCMRCYDFSYKQAERLYRHRTIILDSVLGRVKHLEIDFTERLSENYILKRLGSFIGKSLTVNLR